MLYSYIFIHINYVERSLISIEVWICIFSQISLGGSLNVDFILFITRRHVTYLWLESKYYYILGIVYVLYLTYLFYRGRLTPNNDDVKAKSFIPIKP